MLSFGKDFNTKTYYAMAANQYLIFLAWKKQQCLLVLMSCFILVIMC